MRDGKAYTAFGYETFEDYCENMVGMKRSNAYKYITIVENLSEDKIQTYGQIGISKLSLLASLSHVEQDEIVNVVDVNNVSYRELQAKIKEIENATMNLKTSMSKQRSNLSNANERIEELESRPVEVSIQEDTESKNELKNLKSNLVQLKKKMKSSPKALLSLRMNTQKQKQNKRRL